MPYHHNYVFKSDLLQEKPLGCNEGKTGSVNAIFTLSPLNKLVKCDIGFLHPAAGIKDRSSLYFPAEEEGRNCALLVSELHFTR